MQWLQVIVEQLIARRPGGTDPIVVSSGVSPSGTYHLGTLREVLTAEIIAVELRRRGYTARHIHVVDDLDVFRKVPADVSAEWERYLGRPLCDVPAPDGSSRSYADFFVQALFDAAQQMHLSMEVIRAHQYYRNGKFIPVIETACQHIDTIKRILTDVSGRKVDEQWSPIQTIENGQLKNRQYNSIDTINKTITYVNASGQNVAVSYADGAVKLSWRVDWPARWSLLGVDCEPFGRDHATKGGSYDTGASIAQTVFGVEPPLPVPYHFINRVGQTKKMSKSKGDVITAAELLTILPTEIVWFFLLRCPPSKQLFFGEGETLLRLFDEFAELQAKPHKTADEQQLLDLCLHGVSEPTVSNVPFSHLVNTYQASLKNPDRTLATIGRSEYADIASKQAPIIRRELAYIDNWLQQWAPDQVKFELSQQIRRADFNENEVKLFTGLAKKFVQAPANADGQWFHAALYELKDELGMQPADVFSALYRLLIGKTHGPRAGYFLSILPQDWLLARLTFKS